MTTTDPVRAVHDAISEAARAANPGTIVTGFVIVIEGTDGTDTSAFIHDCAEGQSLATTLGLLDIGRRHHLARIGDATDG